jgi:lipid II:glycine glycyltransferase (peptidoglycan interpeptide bridge formation enzyme)
MITYRRRGIITVGESWFTADLGASKPDIIHYRSLVEPLEDTQEFTTIWIDLTRPEDELLAQMNKSTRHHVRKAYEYGLRYESWYPDVNAKLDEFIAFHDASNAAKGLPLTDRFALHAHAGRGVLDLSRIADSDGNTLVWHGHYRDRTHVQQTYTASVFRARPDSQYRTYLGRANRWGCWEDMKRFRREGILLYDFGGWYSGTTNEELVAVNFFKEGFGGKFATTYFCTRPLTLLGRLYLWAARHRRGET